MAYTFFYTDYVKDKEIPGTSPCEAEIEQILQTMHNVLQTPDNFFGIVNDKKQTLQFVVENDKSVSIDIPILNNGKYIGSKTEKSTLTTCIKLVQDLNGTEDFIKLIESDLEIDIPKKTWWKFW